MPNISVRIDDERREELDVLAENAGLSRAAYIRDALDVREKYYELREEHAELREDYEELQTEYESLQDAHTELREEHGECEERIEDLEHEYEERIEELQTEVQRLRREKRQILEQREEHTELVKVVKEEQSLAKRKAQAGLWTKTKWALFGMSDEDSG